MQQLLEKLKNTPTDTSLVCSSVNPTLNRVQRLSAQGKVLSNNNPEENLRSPASGLKAKTLALVYVLNNNKQPLMPCTVTKARHLLESRKAKVVRCNPFTIKLLWECENNVQPVTLGVDSGYRKIGFSAVTNKKELFASEVTLRNDVSQKLFERRMYRRGRRNKLWYREPRFDNRIAVKKEGWLAPSIKHRMYSHLSSISEIKKLLPISNIVIETAAFDSQKMQHPEIQGIKYQQGTLYGYELKEYLLEKWQRKCAYCGAVNVPLEVEHIIPKSRGGTDRVSNLTLACTKCNLKKSSKTAEEFGHPHIQKLAYSTLKATAFMNNIRRRLVDLLNVESTYGYVTKHNRIRLGLEKSHVNDAFVIAKGNSQQRAGLYTSVQIRRNNRCLQLNRKGFKPSIRKRRYKLQPHNLIKYAKQTFTVKGVHCKGGRVMLDNKKSVKIEEVKLQHFMRGWQFLPCLKAGVSLA